MTNSDSIKIQIGWVLIEKYNWSGSEIIQGKRQYAPNELDDINRLRSGEPVDYVIGWKEFLGCHIDLSLKPLIPRPETEFLVSRVISELNKESPLQQGTLPNGSKIKILDLCCGAGCIGIALLKHLPNVSVDFVDIDENALEQTGINLRFLYRDPPAFDAGGSRIIKSDLFDNLKECKFNYILCNPPYVNTNDKYDSSLKFEPRTALFARNKGMYFINKILKGLNNHLLPNGALYLEFGHGQKDLIEKELKKLNISKYSFHKDQYKRWRWVVVDRQGLEP